MPFFSTPPYQFHIKSIAIDQGYIFHRPNQWGRYKAGLLVEFIPMQIGTGMTGKSQRKFFNSLLLNND
jgi:hypothetical protein